ncbi:hypothetical protein [Hominisplanchenecus murintestinalis]|uniref:hypothetical protein n=1 Tax=Hominisplanchenecus murintestinalis TaxID=2941517 RepID=UPI0013642BB6|nr:hypothetical protein [Hominisplanchenecus murintestinalis]
MGKKSDVDALAARGILFSFVSVAIKELTDEKMSAILEENDRILCKQEMRWKGMA